MSFMSTKLILKSVNGEACFMSYMYLQNIYILDKCRCVSYTYADILCYLLDISTK